MRELSLDDWRLVLAASLIFTSGYFRFFVRPFGQQIALFGVLVGILLLAVDSQGFLFTATGLALNGNRS